MATTLCEQPSEKFEHRYFFTKLTELARVPWRSSEYRKGHKFLRTLLTYQLQLKVQTDEAKAAQVEFLIEVFKWAETLAREMPVLDLVNHALDILLKIKTDSPLQIQLFELLFICL